MDFVLMADLLQTDQGGETVGHMIKYVLNFMPSWIYHTVEALPLYF